jgi:hypothetical protein
MLTGTAEHGGGLDFQSLRDGKRPHAIYFHFLDLGGINTRLAAFVDARAFASAIPSSARAVEEHRSKLVTDFCSHERFGCRGAPVLGGAGAVKNERGG